jgi:hypothetical protein
MAILQGMNNWLRLKISKQERVVEEIHSQLSFMPKGKGTL